MNLKVGDNVRIISDNQNVAHLTVGKFGVIVLSDKYTYDVKIHGYINDDTFQQTYCRSGDNMRHFYEDEVVKDNTYVFCEIIDEYYNDEV